MLKEFSNQNDCVVIDTSIENEVNYNYVELMQRSIFALCPRGYGKTSFRICEALQLGAIPVYIHDGNPWLPFRDIINWNKFCITLHYNDLNGFHLALKSYTKEQIDSLKAEGKALYSRYYNNRACVNYIEENLGRKRKLT